MPRYESPSADGPLCLRSAARYAPASLLQIKVLSALAPQHDVRGSRQSVIAITIGTCTLHFWRFLRRRPRFRAEMLPQPERGDNAGFHAVEADGAVKELQARV